MGEGLSCTEQQVSICAKDSGGPYHYDVVTGLVNAARAAGADFAVDVYPHYGSDAEAALKAGWDCLLYTSERQRLLDEFAEG